MAEAGARRPFARGVAALASGTLAGHLAVVLAAPALTRLYGPDLIGHVGLALSYIGLAAVVVGLRYEAAIVGAGDDAEAGRLLAGALLAAIPISAMACVGLALLIRWDVLGFGVLPTWVVWAAWPVLLLTYLAAAGRFVLIRSKSYDQVARMLVGQGVGRALAPLALAPWGLGGLLAGEGLGRFIGLGAAWRACRARLAEVRFSEVGATLRSAWKYPAVFLPSSLVDAAATLIPLPIVADLYGPVAAGHFALVQRLMAAPIGLVASSVADVFHREALERRGGTLRPLVLATAGRLFLYALIPAAVAGGLAPLVFPWLFGREWEVAGWLFLALVPYAVAAIAVSPVTRVVLVVNRQEVKLVYDVAALVLAIGSLVGSHAAGLGVVEAVAAYSVLQAVAFALYLTLLARVAGGSPSAA